MKIEETKLKIPFICVLCLIEEVCAQESEFPLWQVEFTSRQVDYFLNTDSGVNRLAKDGRHAMTRVTVMP